MADDPQPAEETKAAPVSVENSEPIPVKVEDSEPVRVRAEQDKVAARVATTTDKALAAAKVDSDAKQHDARIDADILRTDDQRRISGIWERTQQIIALGTVFSTIAVAGFKAIYDALSDPQRSIAAGPAFLFLVAASNLVIGFYFGRTNHQRVGGGTATQSESDFGR